MNNAEFAKEARARQQWADEMPEDLESLLAAWASVDLDLTEALRRLEQDEKRIEELEKLARWAVKAKANLQIRSEGRNWIGPLLNDYPQAEGEK